MVNSNSVATHFNTPQYHGRLITQGNPITSFLNRLGGIGGGGAKEAKSWEFALNSHNALDASTQKSITETGSVTAPTPRAYDRGQDTQIVQIFQYGVGATYAAQSDQATLSGLAIAGPLESVNDPLASNLNETIMQAQQDIEFHCLNGLYKKAANAGEANQMRGIFSRTVDGGGAGVTLSSNDQDCGGDALTTADFDALMLLMKETTKVPTDNLTIIGRYSALKKLYDLYGVAPYAGPLNNIGTLAGKINTIVTEAGIFPCMECQQMPSLTLGFLDFSKISLVFLPKPEKPGSPGGYFFYEPLAKTGASDNGQLYGQISIDITAEEYHGQLWNFT